eukprot:CAMPEP_0197319464 /NCGR_PEP_ID=MMETSP0891-20130614/54968_1 /TAXON_ID=44058 ORGANISM="Aureoumbra lagunensis, Strain CCMP1510" /NCGR_SAMPLE_ID=MMETSP0891 /ASSEMBLY_ACC=CAM_ASM_000534 /LENGTH=363 /DNA_ID=CAMNT_0042810401 /DNA_START=141 /DNA_END=1232 /DNA_ORIENTATION=+
MKNSVSLLRFLIFLLLKEGVSENCTSSVLENDEGVINELPRLTARIAKKDPEQMRILLLAHGALVVENVVSDEIMDKLSQDLERDPSGTFFGRKGSFAGEHSTRNAGKPLGESEVAQALAVHEITVGAVESILNPYCKRIILGTCSAINVIPPPNASTLPADAQPLHRDDSMWDGSTWINRMGCSEDIDTPHFSVSVMWAVSDFTATNGATRVALGSHKECPRSHQPDPDLKLTTAVMSKGSVLLWLGSTYHGAGSHAPREEGEEDDTTRRGLLFIYNLGYLRSEHNFHNSMPLHVIQTLPDKLRDLIGYAGTNAIEHEWYTGPVYTQPYLGGPAGSAAGNGVQFKPRNSAAPPTELWQQQTL